MSDKSARFASCQNLWSLHCKNRKAGQSSPDTNGKFYATSKNSKTNFRIKTIENNGLYKKERIITSPQGAEITVNGETVLNFCANNYLGLSSHPEVIQAAKDTLDSHGFGMSSVRFICGTQDIHKELEKKISEFLGTEDTILYAAAFDANGGVFEPLLNEEDAIISDKDQKQPLFRDAVNLFE